MSRPVSFLVLAAIVPMSACGPSISSARFMSAEPAPPAQEVKLYSTQGPSCPYDELGVVLGKQRGFASLQATLDGMVRRARDMGGDAIVGVRPGQSIDASGVGETLSVDSKAMLAGTVIRFQDRGCTN